jgi:type IV secretory pathway VirB10-like protein
LAPTEASVGRSKRWRRRIALMRAVCASLVAAIALVTLAPQALAATWSDSVLAVTPDPDPDPSSSGVTPSPDPAPKPSPDPPPPPRPPPAPPPPPPPPPPPRVQNQSTASSADSTSQKRRMSPPVAKKAATEDRHGGSTIRRRNRITREKPTRSGSFDTAVATRGAGAAPRAVPSISGSTESAPLARDAVFLGMLVIGAGLILLAMTPAATLFSSRLTSMFEAHRLDIATVGVVVLLAPLLAYLAIVASRP